MLGFGFDEVVELLVEFLDSFPLLIKLGCQIPDFLFQVRSSRYCYSGPSSWIDFNIFIFRERDFAESLCDT